MTSGSADSGDSMPVPMGKAQELGAARIEEAEAIVRELLRLLKLAAPVAVYSDADTPQAVGRIAAVEEDFGKLDFAPFGEPVIPAGRLLFVAVIPGIKFQFECEWGGQVFPDEPTLRLRAGLPRVLLKHQRRRSERVSAPLGLPFSAEFSLGGRLFECGIDDLSLGGAGLRASPSQGGLLYVGRRLSRVRMLLGGELEMTTDLDVRSRRTWHSYLAGEQLLLGCSFVALKSMDESILREAISWLTSSRTNSVRLI